MNPLDTSTELQGPHDVYLLALRWNINLKIITSGSQTIGPKIRTHVSSIYQIRPTLTAASCKTRYFRYSLSVQKTSNDHFNHLCMDDRNVVYGPTAIINYQSIASTGNEEHTIPQMMKISAF
ncbi:hypothetical protein AYI68_g2803 [Smittium mucronatum]|uniref:Uncharacterized protein n=1 Tax=Smittium mucronatum TaxID=133383 RepID=A0A1R0H1Q4_9FUNG|nr:hypothetical protein AYI68_g2803 [Smittium mucronatum]